LKIFGSEALIKSEAQRLGFLACGISKATFLAEEAPRLEQWLNQNYNGEMAYMANHFDLRLDPRKLVDGAKSVITVLLNYFPEQTQRDPLAPKISKYAYGQDYHHVIKDKLRQLTEFIGEELGEVNGRAFVDSAPVMDKTWALRSGLGWMGKHTNIIRPKEGSFFFIGELILDIELEPDAPMQDHCGTCTRCIDACPTEAIIQPYVVDGSKCISYFTIELKDIIPLAMKGKFDNWAFGCDVCQDVCPWNRFAKPNTEPAFNPHRNMLDMSARDWNELTEEVFMQVFQKSAVKRAKFSGLHRNLAFLRPAE
jgi:epoxyqueuosine reductase